MLRIVETAIGLPSLKLTDEDYDIWAEIELGTSFKKTYIKERYFVKEETSTDLALRAVRGILNKSNLKYEDIDLLICANATNDIALPYNAALLNAKIESKKEKLVHTFDVGASCLSFLNALEVAYSLMLFKKYKRAVIVSTDISHFCMDKKNIKENGIFGDGSAAVLIEVDNEKENNILASKFVTIKEGVDFCKINHGGSRVAPGSAHEHLKDPYFKMDAKNIYKVSKKYIPDFIDSVLKEANLKLEDIDLFIPHQASYHAMEHLVRELKIDGEKVVNIFQNFGNQVAASLPTALAKAIEQKKIKNKDKVMLFGTGAGLTIGAIIMEYRN